MIIFPEFGARRHTQQKLVPPPVEPKPELTWQMCPVTQRPVMVWTLPEPLSLPIAATA
jgi:hypothetical protein